MDLSDFHIPIDAIERVHHPVSSLVTLQLEKCASAHVGLNINLPRH